MTPDEPTRPGGAWPRPRYILELELDGQVHALELPDRDEVVIGRGAGAEVRVDHLSVSREHARLHLGAALALEDLDSRNGTFVHGARLVSRSRAPISPGDPIELGSVVVRVGLAVGSPNGRDRRARGSGRRLLDHPEGWYADASDAMTEVLSAIDRIAPSEVSVLLLGETGVGKEVCAERLHRRSARTAATFLRLNCSALPESLIESELFGHEKGAFTGASASKPGLIEAADGGTVFLDEIGELPPPVQVKLLRVLDRCEVLRVGGLRERVVDVRFVAATHRDLDAEIAAGRFRSDLYYRLAQMTIRIPPLRERVSEIASLAARFAEDAARRQGRPPPRLTARAIAALERHPWPGNIRELRNAIERAVVTCDGDALEPNDLPGAVADDTTGSFTGDPAATQPFARTLRDEIESFEKERILAALDAAGGNQSEAARRLGISRGLLLSRMRAWRR